MIKQKILEFALNNWKAILIVLLLAVIALKNSRDYKLMQTAYETQIESHEAQIEGLKEIHKKEIREKQKLMENHMESIAIIEEDYENALEMIEQIRRDKKGEYRNKFNQDREQLIKDIESRFGIQYAP
jgi:membrane-associated HD superfamily phosphohydrolase